MIIRHAEKHQHGMHGRGVDTDGRPSRHELTVQGWQRAGALVRFFGQPGAAPAHPAVQTPRSIFASDATRQSPSLRAMHTAAPLAGALGIEINHDYAEGEEDALAAVVLAAPSPVLIVWHHGSISLLATKIAGEKLGCPGHWPEDRFDVVWILERDSAHHGWVFSQVPQCLLPGDCPNVF
jgi:broad specificity phosphatase PhoE